MQVRVYQIDPDRDKNRVMYERLNDLARHQGNSKVDETQYRNRIRHRHECGFDPGDPR